MRERLETFEHSSPPTREDMLRFAQAECDLVLQSTEQQERLVLLEDALVLSYAKLQKIRRDSVLLQIVCERLRGEKAEVSTLQSLIDALDDALITAELVCLRAEIEVARETANRRNTDGDAKRSKA